MQQEITWLDVAMNYSLAMCIVEGGGSLVDINAGFPKLKCTTMKEQVTQASPCEIGHHQVGMPIVLTIFIDGHDVDMFEPGDDIGFPSKTSKKIFVHFLAHCGVGEQDLNSYIT